MYHLLCRIFDVIYVTLMNSDKCDTIIMQFKWLKPSFWNFHANFQKLPNKTQQKQVKKLLV